MPLTSNGVAMIIDTVFPLAVGHLPFFVRPILAETTSATNPLPGETSLAVVESHKKAVSLESHRKDVARG